MSGLSQPPGTHPCAGWVWESARSDGGLGREEIQAGEEAELHFTAAAHVFFNPCCPVEGGVTHRLVRLLQVSKPQAPDATHFSWCPDGEHIVTATCSPRLRVSNGYKIWHYTGSVLHRWEVADGGQLWEVCWQPFLPGSFPEKAIKYQAVPSELGSTQAAPTQAYRPPALRHLPATPSSKLVSVRNLPPSHVHAVSAHKQTCLCPARG